MLALFLVILGVRLIGLDRQSPKEHSTKPPTAVPGPPRLDQAVNVTPVALKNDEAILLDFDVWPDGRKTHYRDRVIEPYPGVHFSLHVPGNNDQTFSPVIDEFRAFDLHGSECDEPLPDPLPSGNVLLPANHPKDIDFFVYDIVIHFDFDIEMAEITSLDTDEAVVLRGYNQQDQEIRTDEPALCEQGNIRAARLRIETDGALGFIRTVRVDLTEGRFNASIGGPEAFDQFKFRPARSLK